MRTLEDIVPPSRRKEMEPMGQPAPANRGPLKLSKQSPKFPFVMSIATVLIIASSIGTLFYFSISKVEVTPNTISAAVQDSFTATQSGGNLSFEIITAQKIASQSVKSSGTKMVSSAASGTITIYNTQTKTQKLIANTRFATAAGLIFRIHSAVTIPAGTSTKPGSIVAKVYADQTGSTYNIDPTSFTIPGFAGTPQASQVYARSSSPMTGGASGNVPVIDAAIEAQTRGALIAALTPDLLASLKKQIPEGYILIPGTATTTYQTLTPTLSSTAGQADAKEQGTITAVIFPNAELAKAIASSVVGIGYRGEPITITSADTLLLTARNGLPQPQESSFSFALTGTASLVYSVDPARIAATVAGKTRPAAQVALTNYPEVKQAVLILRPFWRQTFPQDPASISIVTATGAY